MFKKILPLVLAGAFGGAIALFGSQLFSKSNEVSANNNTSAQSVNLNNAPQHNNAAFVDLKSAAKIAMPVVVHISATENMKQQQSQQQQYENFFFGDIFGRPNQPKQGTGSGVIFSDDGYIVTNNHVVDFADKIQVTLNDNRIFDATIVGTDPNTDLAVLKINATDLPTIQLANSDNAEVGDWVLAVGNPFDLTSTVTAGIISAKARNINILSGRNSIESFIQTDAAVNPGNSGGALVDAEGKLLGINTAIATRTGSFSGYSFAIPIKIAEKIVNDIIQFGSTQRGMVGITLYDLDSDLAEELGVNINQGVVVNTVIDRSAGQYAGILPNDVITEVDGKSIKTSPELQELIGRRKPGDVVNFTIVRGSDKIELPVTLKKG